MSSRCFLSSPTPTLILLNDILWVYFKYHLWYSKQKNIKNVFLNVWLLIHRLLYLSIFLKKFLFILTVKGQGLLFLCGYTVVQEKCIKKQSFIHWIILAPLLKVIDRICVYLFLHSPFCCNDLYIYPYGNNTWSWLLHLITEIQKCT